MSSSNRDSFDESASRRGYATPHNQKHQIPTIAGYQECKEERQDISEATVPEKVAREAPEGDEKEGLLDSAKRHLGLATQVKDNNVDEEHPYKSHNRNIELNDGQERKSSNDHRDIAKSGGPAPNNKSGEGHGVEDEEQRGPDQSKGNGSILQDTSEAVENTLDPKAKRKNMKHMKRDHAGKSFQFRRCPVQLLGSRETCSRSLDSSDISFYS